MMPLIRKTYLAICLSLMGCCNCCEKTHEVHCTETDVEPVASYFNYVGSEEISKGIYFHRIQFTCVGKGGYSTIGEIRYFGTKKNTGAKMERDLFSCDATLIESGTNKPLAFEIVRPKKVVCE